MTPRTRSRRPGVRAVLLAAAAASALTGCSALGDPSVAATLDGEVVATQADVATVVEELPVDLTGGAPVPAAQVITFLALEPGVRELAIDSGAGVVGETEALEFLASVDEEAGREPGSYSEPTLRLIASNLQLGQLTQDPEGQAAADALVADVRENLVLNPRFGQVSDDDEQLIEPVRRPWLESTDS